MEKKPSSTNGKPQAEKTPGLGGAPQEEKPAPKRLGSPPSLQEKPKPAAKEPVGASNGGLTVTSVPFPVQISVDGKSQSLKRKHFKGQLAAGDHKVRIEIRNGSVHEDTVRVKEGQETEYCWNFAKKSPCSR